MSMEALGRRAVACKHWQWMPGMAVLGGFAGVDRLVTDKFGMVHVPDADAGVVPDLSDPATRGAVLALVRGAYADRSFGVRCVAGLWYEESTTRALVARGSETEAEALVAALEAAP